MSFYINNTCPIKPGPITNQTPPVCERICCQVKKVFDACVFQVRLEDVLLTATGFNPPLPVQPLTFISAVSAPTGSTTSDIVIERIADRPNFARVSGNCIIPAIITYTDANGVLGTASSSITVPFSTVLFFPQNALTPIAVECFGSFTSTLGTYLGDNVFRIDCCVTIVIKIVADVEVLLPSYGYCPIPECQCTNEDVCDGFFNQPLFPSAR